MNEGVVMVHVGNVMVMVMVMMMMMMMVMMKVGMMVVVIVVEMILGEGVEGFLGDCLDCGGRERLLQGVEETKERQLHCNAWGREGTCIQ